MAKKANGGNKSVGQNIEWREENGKLIVEIDLAEKGVPSNSGKTVIVASTQGNKAMADGILGLNFYRYPDKKKGK